MDTISIDDCAPMPVKRPATVAELCGIVKEVRATGQGIYPVGGRTTLDVGLPPIKPGVAVETIALNRVIDYPARDMTITVQAGITIAALQAELAKEGQWLPVDVASPEKATLGGAIALNQSGPRRYGYGTLRDYVIGISFVTDDGVEVKAGGRVVKNVAGYDLMKLQIGAVGTLGVVTQVTLKVKPRPEASAAVAFGCDSDSLATVLDLLHASKSRPVAVELVNRLVAQFDGGCLPSIRAPYVLVVGFEEKASTADWQVNTLLDELKAAPICDIVRLGDPRGNWYELAEWQVWPESRFIWKASVRPSRLAEFVSTLPANSPIHAEALSGIVWYHGSEAVRADEVDGNAIVRRCPVEAKKSLPVWGKPTPAWDLMRHVKKTLDPDNVFNPGRLFGDL